MQQLDAVLQYRRQAEQDQMAKRFKRCYTFEVVIFSSFFLNTQILMCGSDGMMSQPETQIEGREENKNHSLNSINC